MEKFKVTYLKHSIFEDCHQVVVIVDKGGLIEILHHGMISVLLVEAVR